MARLVLRAQVSLLFTTISWVIQTKKIETNNFNFFPFLCILKHFAFRILHILQFALFLCWIGIQDNPYLWSRFSFRLPIIELINSLQKQVAVEQWKLLSSGRTLFICILFLIFFSPSFQAHAFASYSLKPSICYLLVDLKNIRIRLQLIFLFFNFCCAQDVWVDVKCFAIWIKLILHPKVIRSECFDM